MYKTEQKFRRKANIITNMTMSNRPPRSSNRSVNGQGLIRSVGSVDPPAIEALRRATRSRHAQLSASPAMSRLFEKTYTIAEYQSHLGRLLGLFEPLEYAVACASGIANDICTLERSSALREDLTIMGASASEIDALERCSWLRPLEHAGLYGYAYVMLGSMMGGKIIVDHLRPILGDTASFHFYGDGMGRSEALWASFNSRLQKNGNENIDAICATAVEIFDSYVSWLSEPLLRKDHC